MPACRIEGHQFTIEDSFLQQGGVCLWPPTSASTSFTASVTLYFHAASNGFVRNNTLLWICAAFDMDVSSRIVFEDNTINCTYGGNM